MEVTKILLYIMVIALITLVLSILYGTYTLLVTLNVPDWAIVATISILVALMIGTFVSCIPGDANIF